MSTEPTGRAPEAWTRWPTATQRVLRLSLVIVAAFLAVTALTSPHLAPSTEGHDVLHLLDDEFDGTSLDATVWNTCYPWGCTIESNEELQYYESSQVRVSNGVLRLTAEPGPVRTADGSFPYRSGMISSGPAEQGGTPKFAFTYGTVEARMRVPAGKGLWSAIWMLPAFGDSRPEIDIVEVLGDDTRTSHHTLHRTDRDSEPFQHRRRGADLAEGWHVFRLVWLPKTLRWYVDSELIYSVRGDEVPDEPMYVMANLAVGGRWPGSPGRSTQFPASMAIDYMKIRPQTA